MEDCDLNDSKVKTWVCSSENTRWNMKKLRMTVQWAQDKNQWTKGILFQIDWNNKKQFLKNSKEIWELKNSINEMKNE